MKADIQSAIGERLGAAIVEARSLPGGDISEAWRLRLDDGREVFAKTDPRAPAEMFPAEGAGLDWLRVANGPRVPEVLATDAQFLVLEWIDARGGADPGSDEAFGRALATLHGARPSGQFGGPRDNFLARIPQANPATSDWPSFYRDHRLAPMLDRVGADGALRRRFDALFRVLDDRCGPAEPPSRLHGDLWSGNALRDASGRGVVIDPAVYAGHREVDLAMMRLFGGFSARVFAAYEERSPLAPGADARVPLYQLYPLLVHLALFGAGYRGAVEAALDHLV